MQWDKKLKEFLDDRPNPFLKRYILKMIKENDMDIKWDEKEDPEKYYSLCFKNIKGELNLRKDLQEYYFQWQIANNLLESGAQESERIAGMMIHSGVFALKYANMLKEFEKTKKWDETKFEKIWEESKNKL